MVYDITDPANAEFVNYINSRDFSDDIAGDVSPEGLCFIPAGESLSGNAELLAAHEVSGTVAIYELTAKSVDSSDDGTTDDDSTTGDDNTTGDDSTTGDNNTSGDNSASGSDADSNSGTNEKANTVKTGDTQSSLLWSILLTLAIGTFSIVLIRRRK